MQIAVSDPVRRARTGECAAVRAVRPSRRRIERGLHTLESEDNSHAEGRLSKFGHLNEQRQATWARYSGVQTAQ